MKYSVGDIVRVGCGQTAVAKLKKKISFDKWEAKHCLGGVVEISERFIRHAKAHEIEFAKQSKFQKLF